ARASALSEAAAALSGRAARVASARAGAREAGLSRHGAAAPFARATAAAAGDRTAAAARERAAGGRARSAARSQAAAARGRAPAGPGDRARRRSAVGRPGGAARDQPDVVLELRADRARGARDEAGGGKQRNRRNRAKSHSGLLLAFAAWAAPTRHRFRGGCRARWCRAVVGATPNHARWPAHLSVENRFHEGTPRGNLPN